MRRPPSHGNYFAPIALLSAVGLFLLTGAMLPGPDNDGAPQVKNHNRLRKRMSIADEAVGVQTKGQLQNLTMNYGQITDTRYEDVGNAPTDIFFDFRYPRQNFTGLCDDFSIFFAIPENSKNGDQGNVIDAWTDNDNEDFVAKDGSYGKTHYNAALDPTPHPEVKYNNATPYLAHSDIPDTWPVDSTGTPFWPGLFRRDPKTGQEVEGEFASDRDIYMEYTDQNNQRGDVLGIEVHEMAYNYGRVYAEDILFYEFFVINKSGKTLQNCWLGFYQDPDCSDYGEETLLYVDSTFADGSKVWSLAQRDFDGDVGGVTLPNSLGILEDYTFGTVFLETPQNIGVTSFHYFQDTGPADDQQLWPIIIGDPTNRNISGSASLYFHGSNRMIDDVSLITTKQDLVWIVASGPFTMSAGDTVKYVIAVTVGDDDADYYSNVWQAKALYDAKFNGPVAPPSPTLRAVAGDRRVTLYWDDAPETYVDPSTGVADFEGYKLYRSEDGGVTWGKQITDAQGRLFGYVPIAQYDVKDNIKGVDARNSLIYLGDDGGLRHSYVDSTVINGKAYTYTIVSYDQGTPTLYSLEATRGDGPQSKNFKTVIPLPDPQGKIPSQLKEISKIAGTGAGDISIQVIDPAFLRTDEYEITLTGTPATAFTVTRLGTSQAVLYDKRPVNVADLPVVDGFKVSISTDSRIGGVRSITEGTDRDVLGSANLSSDSSWYVGFTANAFADTATKSSSYSISFTSQGSIAYSWGVAGSVAQYNVPFEVRNTTTNQQICSEIRDLNNNSQWDEGELIYILNAPYPSPPPAIGSPNPATALSAFAYQIAITNAPVDTLKRPPVVGTVINVACYNALRSSDVYRFSFALAEFDNSKVDLSQIRVVPNPYIVTSQFETLQNVRAMRFMYLPPECTIYIYTVAGVLVKTLYHQSQTGSLSWNLLSDTNQGLAFGVYVYVVEDPSGNKHIGKFALIK
jgi:hypothetical protein